MLRPLFVSALAGCAALAAPTSDLVAVDCTTTKGPLKITINTAWAPVGAQRFLDLVDDHFFDNHPLYRAVDNFLVQFGMAADPQLTQKWTQVHEFFVSAKLLLQPMNFSSESLKNNL